MRIQGTGLAARLGIVPFVRALKRPAKWTRDLVLSRIQRRPASEGWLISRERQYAPQVGVLPGLTSPTNLNAYHAVDLGGDKMASLRNGYGRNYAPLLAPRLGEVRTLVELGVFQGVSLALWCDLFPEAKVVGLDIDFGRFRAHATFLEQRGAFSTNAPDLVRFDAFAPDATPLVDELDGRFIDVFIDDGPHHIDAIVATAKAIVPLMGAGSLYVVEDQTSALGPLREAFPTLGFRMEGSLVVAEIRSGAV
jgi:hypothetical protein